MLMKLILMLLTMNRDIVKDSNTHSDAVGDEATDVKVPMV